MKDFILVFRTIFKNQNSGKTGTNGKKRLSSGVTLILSAIPLIIFICAAVAALTMGITDVRLLAAVMTIIVLAAQLFTLFVGIYSVVNTLYSSSDISVLNSLPIKPVSVFAAKFANVYLNSLGTSALIVIPLLLTSAVTFNIVNGTIFYGIYPFILLISTATPLLPLFVIVLFSMPITYIGTYFKGKPVLKSVLTILIYVILMSAYMVIVYFLNTKGFGQDGTVEISSAVSSVLLTVAKVAYPDYVLINYSLGIDFGINFGISFAVSFGMILLLIILAFLFYRKITEKNLESQSGDANKTETEFKQESVISSLVAKDFKSVIRNSGLAMSSFANTILAPIFIVLMYFISDFKNSSGGPGAVSDLMSEMMGIGFVLMYSAIFISGTNMMAMIAYTREGEGFYITKSLPISARDSVIAKLIISVIPSVIISIIIIPISLFLYKIDIVSSILAAVCTIIITIGSGALHIYCDMKYGNIHWKSAADMNRISKGNKGSFVVTMSCVLGAVIFFIIGIILSAFATQLSIVIIKLIYWCIVAAASLTVMIIGLVILKNKGLNLYQTVGDNTKIPERKKREKTSGRMLG